MLRPLLLERARAAELGTPHLGPRKAAWAKLNAGVEKGLPPTGRRLRRKYMRSDADRAQAHRGLMSEAGKSLIGELVVVVVETRQFTILVLKVDGVAFTVLVILVTGGTVTAIQLQAFTFGKPFLELGMSEGPQF